MSPTLQSAASELQKRRLTVTLTHHLNHRPTAGQLVEKNILKGTPLLTRLVFLCGCLVVRRVRLRL